MIDLGKVEGKVGGEKPEAKGYQFILTSITEAKAKSSGNKMFVLEFDISEGKYKGFFSKNKLIYRQVIEDEDGLARFKGMAETIVDQNKLQFPEDEIDWATFEEKRLVGSKTWGVLKYNDRGYLELSYLTTEEKAKAVKPAQRPEAKLLDTGNPDGLF